jgi:polyisoprenoid-binding protein YceI
MKAIPVRSMLFAASFACAGSAAFAAPPAWTVDKTKSSIAFAGQHASRDFTGTFETWDATILFDPADLAHSSAKVTIATRSAKTGDETKDGPLAEEEWFNPAKFPSASFETSQIVAAGNGYVATGTLTIKGKALPLTLPFTLDIKGQTAIMAATATIDRLAYDLGTLSDGTGTFVTREIALTINVTATRAP